MPQKVSLGTSSSTAISWILSPLLESVLTIRPLVDWRVLWWVKTTSVVRGRCAFTRSRAPWGLIDSVTTVSWARTPSFPVHANSTGTTKRTRWLRRRSGRVGGDLAFGFWATMIPSSGKISQGAIVHQNKYGQRLWMGLSLSSSAISLPSCRNGAPKAVGVSR